VFQPGASVYFELHRPNAAGKRELPVTEPKCTVSLYVILLQLLAARCGGCNFTPAKSAMAAAAPPDSRREWRGRELSGEAVKAAMRQPDWGALTPLVEPMGFEPTTSTVQTSRSPN
jgi:hypothetical protein